MPLDNKSPIWNLPNILTLLRIATIPLLVAILFSPSRSAGFWAAAVFAVASVTDWLDGYLARRLHEHCLTLLLTWRTEDIGASHPLRHLLGEALRHGRGSHLNLARLDRDAVREWVKSVTHHNGELSERIYKESEGLPFFVVEYLAALSEADQKAAPPDWALPRGMRDLIHSRLGALSETDRQILTCAAVIGRSLDFDILREASGRSEEETIEALDHLQARGLIRETSAPINGQAQYDFAHEKLRAVVYDETSLARRRLVHRRVAEALAQHARTRSSRDQASNLIAHHYQLAGQEILAAEYFERAGQHARELFANAEGIANFRSALALGHPEPGRLHEALGDLLTLTANYGAALASYENAAAVAGAEDLARLEHKLGNVHGRRGDWELAETHYQTAHAGLKRGDAAELARLEADRSLAAHGRGDDTRALEFGKQALEFANRASDTRALAQTYNLLGILARSAGDKSQALEYLQASLTSAEKLKDPPMRAAALNNLALVYRENGELNHARELTESALAICVALGDRHREAALRNNLSDLLHALGEREKAMEQLKYAVMIFSEIGQETGNLQPEIWKLVEW